MNPRFRQGRTDPALLAVLILAPLLLATCQDFFGTSDLKQQIKDDVIDATAPTVTVNIVSPTPSMGSPTDPGVKTWKVGVTNTITTTVTTGYAFAGWAATGDQASAPDVTFSDAAEETTTVTVNAAYSGTITITPSYDPRPKFEDSDPYDGQDDVDRNQNITIWFSEELDPASLILGDTIKITTRPNNTALGTEEVSIDSYFKPPVVSGSSVLLALKEDSYYNKLYRIYVRLSTDIHDLDGYPLAEEKKFRFITGDGIDSTAPVINSFTITNAVGVESSDSSQYAYTNGGTINLNIDAVDDKSQVAMMKVIETPCDSSGMATGDSVTHDARVYESTILFTLAASADGWTKLQVKVADSKPNWSDIAGTTDDTKLVLLDTVRPTTPSVTGDDSPYEPTAGDYWCGSSGVTFTLSSTESDSGLAGYTTDSAGLSPAPDLTPTLSSSGILYAVDKAGNVSSSGLSLTVHQDTTPPGTPTFGSSDSPYDDDGVYWADSSSGVEFTLSSDDGSGSGIKGYSTSSSGSSPVASPFSRTSGATFYAVDKVGNVSTSGLTLNVSLDLSSPEKPSVTTSSGAVFTSGSSYWFTSGSGVTFTFTSSDGTGSQVEGYYRDASGTTAATGSALAAGSYNIYAIDNVGHASSPLAITVGKDNTKPGTPTVSGTPYLEEGVAAYHDGSGNYWYPTGYSGVTFTLASDDGSGSQIQGYSTSSSGSSPAESPLCLADGSHTYYAVDNVDLVSTGSLSLTVKRDSSAPTTPTVSDHSGYYYGGSKYWYPKNDSDGVSFTISSTDPAGGSGFKEYLLGSVSTTASQTKTAGTYVYTATDKAGNTSSSLTVTIAQDSAPPTIGGTLASTDGTSVSGFSASDPAGGSGLDTDSYDASSGSFDGSALSGLTAPTEDGDTDYTVSVSDNAGNAATVTVRLTRSTDGEGTVSYTAAIVLP